MRTLALLTLALSAVDHWTTYLCLRQPVEGWMVSEANPISRWLFGAAGLVPGLLIDSLLTVLAVGFLAYGRALPSPARCSLLLIVIFATAFAVQNNLGALSALGLSPLGGIQI